jgi:putative membrane protein
VLPGADPRAALGARPPSRARLLAPLSYPNLGLSVDERYVVCSSGFLRRRMVVVPLAKVQSLRRVQGPVARFLRLSTVHVDLVGRRWRAAVRLREAEQAEALWPQLAERARLARQQA